MSHAHKITDAAEAIKFIFAGKATVTFVSTKSGARFTYKVTEAKRKEGKRGPLPFFVKVLNGPDNTAHYGYLGTIFERNKFRVTAKSSFNWTSPSVKAFNWAFGQLLAGRIPDGLEVWHEGKCGKCGRKLTVPASIATGLGPKCAGGALKRASKTIGAALKRNDVKPLMAPGQAEAEQARLESEYDREQTARDEAAKAAARDAMETPEPEPANAQTLLDWMNSQAG